MVTRDSRDFGVSPSAGSASIRFLCVLRGSFFASFAVRVFLTFVLEWEPLTAKFAKERPRSTRKIQTKALPTPTPCPLRLPVV
jgi:hypothetical protein